MTCIRAYTFQGCTSLKEVTLSGNLESIGASAFKYCPSLANIYMKAETPPSFAYYEGGFTDSTFTTCKLHVPKGCVEAYRQADVWKKFTTIAEME